MLGGIWMEAMVAEMLGFTPQLHDGMEMDREEMEKYRVPASRVEEWFHDRHGLEYQPVLCWPHVDLPEETKAEGHPDFIQLDDRGSPHIIDLKTTEYPTEELLNKLLHSIQMCAYMAAYERERLEPPRLSIVLASRLEQPHPVEYNKNGTVSLSGQNSDHASLLEAVQLMGDKADDRHWALAYKAPTWQPMLVGTLEPAECHELAKIGTIFLSGCWVNRGCGGWTSTARGQRDGASNGWAGR